MVPHTTPAPSNKELLFLTETHLLTGWDLITPLDTWASPPILFNIHRYSCTHMYNNLFQIKIKYILYSKCEVWLLQIKKAYFAQVKRTSCFKTPEASFDFILLGPRLSEHCLADEVLRNRRSWDGTTDILKEQRNIFSTAPSHTFSTASIKWHALYENDTCHLFLSTSQNTVVLYINL